MNSSDNSKVCRFCNKLFSKTSNCNRHVKNVHSVSAHGEAVENKVSCDLCGKKVSTNFNLQRHIEAIHFTQNAKLFKCHRCNFCTTQKSNLKRHLQKFDHVTNIVQNQISSLNCHENKVHKAEQIKRKCPLCKFVSHKKKKDEMHSHFETRHNIKLKWEQHTFSSQADFLKWKKETEIVTTTSFIKTCGTKKNIQNYFCHRFGNYKHKGLNKRRLKITGSCKIGAFCPASIKVSVKDEKEINVLFLKSHVGHKNELKHKRLTKEERTSSQLTLRKPHDEILREIRNSLNNCDLQRIHLINKQDIANIERSFNLYDEALKHPFDPVSIAAWVETLKSSSKTSFVIYKPQGSIVDEMPNLENNDFLLMFMTKSQEEMLKQFGKDIICIDGTHDRNSYDFQLYTLLVVDETREGFPVAFMISNKGDEKVFTFFMNTIREKVGPVCPSVFMSDMEDTFYTAWTKVMGPARQLYCSWHVLRAWEKKLRCKIKKKGKQDVIFKVLKALIYELDIRTFHTILNKALDTWKKDNETIDFYKYFLHFYVEKDNFKKWAYCYIVQSGINTNISMGNFNRLLKYCYLKGKKTKPLDKTLCALLYLLKDKLFELIIKIYKGKVLKKLRILKKRHRESYALSNDSFIKEGDNRWYVPDAWSSQYSDFYVVQKIKTCSSCLLLCDHCDSCFHEYICSCMDSSIRSNMCKHIHLVAMNNKNEEEVLDEILLEDCPFFNDEEDGQNCNNVMLNEVTAQTVEVDCPLFVEEEDGQNCNNLMLNEVTAQTVEVDYPLFIEEEDGQNCINVMLNEVTAQIVEIEVEVESDGVEQSSFKESLQKCIQEFNQVIRENVTNMNELEYVETHLSVLLPTLQAMKKTTT